MAVERVKQIRSKSFCLNLLLLTFLGWLILFGWALSLWSLQNFNTAWQRTYQLAKQQAFTIKEFHDAQITQYIESKLRALPTQKLADKIDNTYLKVKNELNRLLPNTNSDLDNIFIKIIKLIQQLWSLICITTAVMYVKIIILVASIPLFVLVTIAGLIDGLNQRAIRTASLGRESSYVFHRLNHYFKRSLFLLLVLWFAMPVSVTPAFVFVPVSILLSVMVSITASRFKKYL
ncbi:TIGR03747 family integrating conjugative element membrane protein [Legionella sp. CNM-1927-20]|uniref:TIGR03747 family integrating conjugative element membrane protein n=1 Tax=Legionella sp. CNM-1927-20 TaxID=3422221 RepID=UPI00403A9FCE